VLTAQEDGSAELDDGPLLMRAMKLRPILVSQDEDLLREGSRLLEDNISSLEEWLGRIEYLPLG
jgi:hypothetical protein